MLDNSRNYCIAAVLALFICCDIKNVSVVYNMKFSETTQLFQKSSTDVLNNSIADPFAVTMALIDQIRETYNNVHQNNIAGYVTLLYSKATWYARLESAVGNVKNKFPFFVPLITSRTQLDDILLSAGYSLNMGDYTRVTATGILGIPTHRDVGLLGAQFGTGHVGIGTRLDVVYDYVGNMNHRLMGAARYIRFLSRTAEALIGQRLIPFDLTLGNLMDMLFSTNHKWGNHQWEAGYNATFAFGARIEPTLNDIEDQIQFIRSSFYTTYSYGFPIRGHESGVLWGVSYGFDHRPDAFGLKRSIAAWFSWGMKF